MLIGLLTVQAHLALSDSLRAAASGSGILHEEIITTERPAKALQPLRSTWSGQTSTAENASNAAEPGNVRAPLDTTHERENLLHQMDVYALSPHAHYLALPRMVSPLLILEAAQGKIPLPSQAQWQPFIEESSQASGLDPRLIAAVIKVESGNNPEAISPKGAQGLMQLMPATQTYLGVTDPYDPSANVRAGSLYLREQLDTFGTLELALAAYNAGPGNVHRYGGIPPFAETEHFIRRVLTIYRE